MDESENTLKNFKLNAYIAFEFGFSFVLCEQTFNVYILLIWDMMTERLCPD